MSYDAHNLVRHTVRAIPRRILPCEVGCAIDPYANGGNDWTWCHRWIKGNKWRSEGAYMPTARCVNCHKTRAELMYPPKPEKKPKLYVASDSALRAAIESGR